MSKKIRRSKISDAKVKPPMSEIILDEGFIMCASGCGCESKNCKGTNLDCQLMALRSLVEAFARKYLLVVDENYVVRKFYSTKADEGKIGRDIARLIFNWLDGRGKKVHPYRIQPLPQKIVNSCPSVAKEKKLDILLCQLALASKAPVSIVILITSMK